MIFFFKKLFAFLLLFGFILLMMLCIIYKYPNLIDRSYPKLTSPKSTSLIIGTSRAAQGLVPQIINSKLENGFDGYIINHAFTLGLTPYGPYYNHFLLKKIQAHSHDGLFVLEVSPTAFTTYIQNENDDMLLFKESQSFVAKISNSSSNPNFEYLIDYYSERHFAMEHLFNVVFDQDRAIVDNNPYGSMTVVVNTDSLSTNKRIKRMNHRYEKELQNIMFSENRYLFFNSLIDSLQTKGEIYLVRLPVSMKVKQIEENLFPKFDSLMIKSAHKHEVPYINLISLSGQYQTTDGSHLLREDAEKVTALLCDSISYYQNKK